MRFLQGSIFTLSLVAASVPLFSASVPLEHTLNDPARILEGFSAHLMALSVILAFYLLSYKPRILGLVPLVMAACWLGFTLQQAKWAGLISEKPASAQLKILSVNILNDYSEKRTDKIIKAVEASGADIVILLEAQTLQHAVTELIDIYPYQTTCEASCDIHVISRYPISDLEREYLNRIWRFPRAAKMRVMLPNDQTFTLVPLHMSKSWVPGAAREQRNLKKFISSATGPIVVAGDFNAPFWSKSLQNIATSNEIVFSVFSPSTWPYFAGPFGIPIDQVGAKGGAEILSLSTWGSDIGSNHKGLIATVTIR